MIEGNLLERSGARAIHELRSQVQAAADNQPPVAAIYPHPIAFNLLPHVDSFLPSGYTKEEMKMQNEGRRIMHLPDFRASVTCVRVPVRVSHSISVNVQTREPIGADRVRALLAESPGLALEHVPSPLQAEGHDEVFVGRIRGDESHPRAFSMFVVSDNLRKGAATNAVQLAELVAARLAPAA